MKSKLSFISLLVVGLLFVGCASIPSSKVTYDIQIEYSWTPMYDSYYIEGIHQLYEFDCGPESGWMYKVNEWFPNYGCSEYKLSGGESIVWCYTCVGLGEDVGGGTFG